MTDDEYCDLEEAISEAQDRKTLEKLAAILKTFPPSIDKQDLARNLASKLSMY